MAKLVGIDYGSKRVGVAVSDDSGSVAFPKAEFSNDARLVDSISALIKEEGASAVVIGESKNASGEENAVMAEARAFSERLSIASGVPVHFEPEFYTSVEARRDAGHSFVDSRAAAIILNSFITRTKPS
jgi:putative Holliday junction resolvase